MRKSNSIFTLSYTLFPEDFIDGNTNLSRYFCNLKSGFYVIEQTGDTMQILAAPEPWQPKAW
ncbi:hypothetical protein FACS1894164_17200 [Spirochaetia bacterium]|nr:hypothetical protein FACS1894164_17200 [Spirochaetia bacterium]